MPGATGLFLALTGARLQASDALFVKLADCCIDHARKAAVFDALFAQPWTSVPGANHRLAAWAAAILGAMDDRWKLILWGRGPDAPRVKQFAQRVYRGTMLVVAEDSDRRFEYEELLSASDLVLNTAKGAVATLPLAISMAAAAPIVSTVTYTASELLEDHHNSLLVPKPSARLLSQRILELNEDSALKWRLTDMARTEAYDYFSLTRFLEQWKTVYQQIAAGEAVEVIERAGAGARFHGRD